jgi:enoyl-CoA hydratase/carnithine racemase
VPYSDYKCFRLRFDSGVAFITIDHPPINLLDEILSPEFERLGRELEADDSVRVVAKVTIAEVGGRARGGGREIALAMDMYFAAAGKAIFGQPEVAIGLVPGGGSTQRLPRLIGRGRALEVLLGCNDLSAELAGRYGYVNRAAGGRADALRRGAGSPHRSFPAHAIAHAKAAVDTGAFSSMAEGLLDVVDE